MKQMFNAAALGADAFVPRKPSVWPRILMNQRPRVVICDHDKLEDACKKCRRKMSHRTEGEAV